MKYCGNCQWYDEVSPQTCQGYCWNYKFICKTNITRVNTEFVCDDWEEKEMKEETKTTSIFDNVHIQPLSVSYSWAKDIETIAKQLTRIADTIDYVPKQHGHWIPLGEYDRECSCCLGIVDVTNYRYCPNCGALMDEVDNE